MKAVNEIVSDSYDVSIDEIDSTDSPGSCSYYTTAKNETKIMFNTNKGSGCRSEGDVERWTGMSDFSDNTLVDFAIQLNGKDKAASLTLTGSLQFVTTVNKCNQTSVCHLERS